jgi:hypothetical protein
MKMMYRWSGTLPEGDWEELVKNYNNCGEWGTVSVGHASNAVVVLTQPDGGGEGIYAVCVGEARRGMTPMYPTGFTTVANATQAFWEIKLAGSPQAVMASARERAAEYLHQARSAFEQLDRQSPAGAHLRQWLEQAEQELRAGDALCQASGDPEKDIYTWSRATRSYTRAQVRAQQVTQAVMPPPCRPEDLQQ